MSYGSEFRFTFFTNNICQAEWADKAGITNIGPDLEVFNKHLRQDAKKTWISDHQESDIPKVYQRIASHKRFVRCNPINSGSKSEINSLIEQGAETIMLPYFFNIQQATTFIEIIDGRAAPFLLVETDCAAQILDKLIELEGVKEIHLGLNDLHLTLGMKNHFELLCSPLMEELCTLLKNSSMPFGFGGVGRALDNSLLISSDLVYAQYPRLGASGALISRVFTAKLSPEKLPEAVNAARDRLTYWSQQNFSKLVDMRDQLADLALQI